MILVKPDEFVLQSGYQVRGRGWGGGGGGEMLPGYPIKKAFFAMSIHARCEFLNRSGYVTEEGYFGEDGTEGL